MKFVIFVLAFGPCRSGSRKLGLSASYSIGPLSIAMLATPFRRAFVVGTLVGIVAFTAGFPKTAFTEEGELRPQRGLSRDPQATNYHFLVTPLSAGLVTFLFT